MKNGTADNPPPPFLECLSLCARLTFLFTYQFRTWGTNQPLISTNKPLRKDSTVFFWGPFSYCNLQMPLLTKWQGQFSAKLNVTSQAAVLWYMDRVSFLKHRLGAEYVVFEGGEGNLFMEQAIPPPLELSGDKYICMLALMAATMGNSSIISAGTRWVPGKNLQTVPFSKVVLSLLFHCPWLG